MVTAQVSKPARPGALGGVAAGVPGDKDSFVAEGVRKKKQLAIDRCPGLETRETRSTRPWPIFLNQSGDTSVAEHYPAELLKGQSP